MIFLHKKEMFKKKNIPKGLRNADFHRRWMNIYNFWIMNIHEQGKEWARKNEILRKNPSKTAVYIFETPN